MKFDTVVLGGGIIGISIAIHLQMRGREVALVDLTSPGSETSFGNAGLIQREGVYPYAFPRDITSLMKYALNCSPEVRYHFASILRLTPFLWKYWFHSHSSRHAEIARSYATLIQQSVKEHHFLAEAAGVRHLLRSGGWLKVFRTVKKQEAEISFAEKCRAEFGIQFKVMDTALLHHAEPDLDPSLLGALHYTESEAVNDPGALVTAYARYFERLGGHFFFGDALTLSGQWTIKTERGQINSNSVVIALGPWSDVLCSRFGYHFPLAVKRGYHMHYGVKENARLIHPVLDFERGYLIAPMVRGVRLTTGVEFARRDSQKISSTTKSSRACCTNTFPHHRTT